MGDDFIPLSVPNLRGKELEYTREAIQDEWVSTGGKFIDEFEERLGTYVDAAGAVACQSGTAGIHLALELCGVEQGDEVLVPSLTFIATVNPVRYVKASPVFLDCDDTLNIDCEKLEHFLMTQCSLVNGDLINKKSKEKIKAIIVVHIFGNLVDMEKIMELAKKYNLKVIEDATEALGSYYITGKYAGRHAGTVGDIGIYSFNGNKIITTGGGGMIVSNNNKFIKRAKYLSTQAKDDDLFYIHNSIGYNYRMTNLQAALGLAQLEKLESFIKIKKENYDRYKKRIDKIAGMKLLDFVPNARPNYWFYSLILFDRRYHVKTFIEHLQNEKIQSRPVWGLIHLQKPYKNYQTIEIEKALYYSTRVLNIPCSTNLTKENVQRVVEAVESTAKYQLLTQCQS